MCSGKWVWGLFFILLGAAWVASNIGMIALDIGNWWPAIFVAIGLSIIGSSFLLGLFFMIIGVVWIAGNLALIPVNIGAWWPLLFIFIGLSILFARPKPPIPFKSHHKKWKEMDWEDIDWDDEDIREDVAKAVEIISKKAVKKIRKGPKKKKKTKRKKKRR